jgi:hypothetical protein
MGRSNLDKKRQEAKSKAVKAPGKAGGKDNAKAAGADDAEVSAMGGEKAAKKGAKKGRKPASKSKEEKAEEKRKEKEEKEKKEGKGAKKALRHAVKAVVRKGCTGFATSLMREAKDGKIRSTEIMLSLMEKKKKDGENDVGWDGLSIAAKLAAEPEWDEEMAKAKREKEAAAASW